MIDGLKPYPRMKDPAVGWLGEVPQHWEVLPNRAIFEEVRERDHPDEEMLSVTITKGVIRQQTLLADSSKKDSSNLDRSAYKLVRPGDIVYNKMRAWQGALGVSEYQGIVSPAYVVERPRPGADARYIHYLLRTPAFAKEAERWSYGITSDMWSLRPEHFKMIYSCLPPRNEQSAIVRFLDHADTLIRRYGRCKQKLITLLEEEKQVIIHRVVTRGLAPDVRLKPSGVEWLGHVPEHWNVVPLRWFISIGSGDFIETHEVSSLANRERQVPVIGGNGHMGFCARTNSQSASIVIGRVGALCGNVHLVEGPAWITDNALRIDRYTGFDSEFLALQLRALGLNRLANANAQPLITGSVVKDQRVVRPDLATQRGIVQGLHDVTRRIDFAIRSTQREISLLRAYRTRLIDDVVTGKLDVREAAARLPEQIDDPEPPDDAEIEVDTEETGNLDASPEEVEA